MFVIYCSNSVCNTSSTKQKKLQSYSSFMVLKTDYIEVTILEKFTGNQEAIIVDCNKK